MLVGRLAEQQALDRLVAAARLGTSGVLAICGEAGVGKTALLDDAVSRLTETRVLRATGHESEREVPYAALLQLLRPALGSLGGIPPRQADALAGALALPRGDHGAEDEADPDRGDASDRFAVGAAVLSLLCRYAEDGPVAAVVDDLHLVDPASANALVFAARRLAADPVVVLFGVRSPEGDDVVAGLPALRVGGLDLAAAQQLLRTADGPRITEEQLGRLHRATAGNPLALLELHTADTDVVESVDAGLPLRAPRAVTRAFGRQLAELDAEPRMVLLVAAVCGADLRLITAACARLGVDASLLGESEDRGFIVLRAGRVEFRHPLLRAAVYSEASAQDRHAAHRAAAAATPEGDADRRAWHLAEATWHPDAEVAGLLAAAGGNAVSRGAHGVASRAFERAAQLSPSEDERAALLLRAADTAWSAGDGGRAIGLLDERIRDGRATGGGDDLGLRAAIAARTGSLRAALELLMAAADRQRSPDEALVSLADAVHATFYLGDARTAAALADRIAGLLPAATTPTSRALGLMASGMARTLAGRGGADDIRAAVPLLESDAELRRDPRRLAWLMLAPLYLRDASSGARLRALVDEVRGSADVGVLPVVLFHVAVDEATTGAAWARAEADYAESIRLASETGQDTERAMSLAGLTRLDARAGRADACRAHGEEANTLCAARDIHVGEVWVAHALGDLELSLGNAAGATERFEGLMTLLGELDLDDADLSPAPELTDALLRIGRRDSALAVAAGFHAQAAAKGQPWARARADRARGLAAGEDFESWFESALEWHAQTLDRFEDARTRLAYGSRLRRTGRRVDARPPLRDAFDTFAELGAVLWRDHAAVELTATGVHVRAPGEDATRDLTPQELQVCLLLADGRTTREAAAALFLSPKTIEYHLRKVYAKLGIGSRAELAAALAGHASPHA